MGKEKRIQTLTFRLLRNGKTIDDAISPTFSGDNERALVTTDWVGVEGAKIIYGQIYNNPPSWQTFVEAGFESATLPSQLFSAGAGAVVFIPAGKRTIAICFGQIHLALNEDAFERKFGLKVTLNSVPRGQLRAMDIATPDAVTFQKRVQASRDSDVSEFGVDQLRDIARVAGGTPSNLAFAKFAAGKDSLSLTCEVDPKSIGKKCNEILKVYLNNNYKNDYPWVDNLQQVLDKELIDKLDQALEVALFEIRKGNDSLLHLSPPEIVNYTDGSELHYNGFGSQGNTFNCLSILDYAKELNRCKFQGSIAEVKSKHRITARAGSQNKFLNKWRIYDCFVFETSISIKGKLQHFILFSGDWFQIEENFKRKIETFFNGIDPVSIIGKTSARNEQELIAQLVATRSDLLKLDKTKINPEGVKNANFEPSDFLSNNGDFIHLKDGNSSGPISHLWFQGAVSAAAFAGDNQFRVKLRKVVKEAGGGFEKQLPISGKPVVRENFKVVYGVMRQPYKNGSLGLPFFSKVSVQIAVENIRALGFKVAIELIEKPGASTTKKSGAKSKTAKKIKSKR